MAFTDHCDVFASIAERPINRVLEHIAQQRPSLVNFATRHVAASPSSFCHPITAHPIVGLRNNPLVTLVEPLPIPGTEWGLDYMLQILNAQVDFHPSDQFLLPGELTPLPPQRLAIMVEMCVGIGCPGDLIRKNAAASFGRNDNDPPKPVTPLPWRELTCFCLKVITVAGIVVQYIHGQPYLTPSIYRLEVVDIQPAGLEQAIECYATLVLKLAVAPKLQVLLATILELTDSVHVNISPTPATGNVPFNPSIANNELAVFIDAEVP